MLILGFLGMYFDAAVVFVMNSSLLFRLAVAILCLSPESAYVINEWYLGKINAGKELWKYNNES